MSGPIYGTISRSPVMSESEKIFGNSSPKNAIIQNAQNIDAETKRER